MRDEVISRGRECRLLSFPDYTTPIGSEIGKALHGERDYGADVMQLLYVANRHEQRAEMIRLARTGRGPCLRPLHCLEHRVWRSAGARSRLACRHQKFLPRPDLTILLDIAPETAVRRKASGRDRYERDLQLLSRVRDSYRRQAAGPGWLRLDGERSREAVSADVITAVSTRLSQA